MKASDLKDTILGILAAADVPEAETDTALILREICGISRADLLADPDREAAEEKALKALDLAKRRAQRIPLQQLLGSTCFMGLDFTVSADVLCPRPDTEILTEEVLREMTDGSRFLELCTGSGCIAISLLRYSNDCTGIATDLSEKALDIARKNASDILGEAADALTFLQGDLWDALGDSQEKFDFVISNPPYIPAGDIASLMPEVRLHEPVMALDGGADGLDFYRRILAQAQDRLKGGGWLYLEIGYDQARAVSDLCSAAGLTEISVIRDYGGNDRVVRAMRSALV
ncbi:MAG: peptide chain release factor N(5)-glutamine methyltransferase [Lachnospiraceae bacterium]|nr:peptide chain release factor N(5)-glutamine methyltransferase [Lachnospiraceae bacterium]